MIYTKCLCGTMPSNSNSGDSKKWIINAKKIVPNRLKFNYSAIIEMVNTLFDNPYKVPTRSE